MFVVRSFRAAAAVVAIVAVTAIAADAPLSRTELAKRGKPATALVLVEPLGVSGTAFVVHPSGLLVTNAHVVSSAAAPRGRVRVALRPGEPDQEVLVASIIRTDLERDLAVLKVDKAKGLTVLPLGDSDRLTELTELVGFGYPFGTRLAAEKTDLPAVTVSISSVTSLRRKAGALSALQLDGALNPGHSGGPLLAADGTVLGVIRTGIPGAQISQAIPANVVKAFLTTPEIFLYPPKFERAARSQPAEFRAEVFQLLPGPPPTLELVLETGIGPPRKFPMTLKGAAYLATALPVPPSGPGAVSLTIRYGPVTVSGPVPDREFTVDGKPVKLSQVRRLEFGGSPKALTHDGGTMNGPIAGLEDVELRMADQSVRLNFAKADVVDLVPPAEPTGLTCTAIASVDGKEVGRVKTMVALPRLAGGPPSSTATASPVGAAKLDSERVTRKLPDSFTDVCCGGGGRYLLFLMPKPGKIALFDVVEARIVHYFPAPDPDTKFAAGHDKLVIGLPGQGLLQRWSLTTFERELTVPFPKQEPIQTLLIGHASNGPLVANGNYLDLHSFKPIDVKLAGQPIIWPLSAPQTRAMISADGSVIGTWNMGIPVPLTMVQTGNTVTVYQQHGGNGGYIAPSPDGKLVFTGSNIYTPDLQPVLAPGAAAAPPVQSGIQFLPAVQGSMYLGIHFNPRNQTPGRAPQVFTREFWLYLPGDSRPLVQVAQYQDTADFMDRTGRDQLALPKRVWLIPDAKVLVTLPTTNDSVQLTRFDLDEALNKSGTDYLFVASDPPTDARKGERYAHQLVVKSKRGSAKCKLDAGPPGMTVTPDGKVEWTVPGDFADGTATVIISVSDASGQEVFKTFKITLGG